MIFQKQIPGYPRSCCSCCCFRPESGYTCPSRGLQGAGVSREGFWGVEKVARSVDVRERVRHRGKW